MVSQGALGITLFFAGHETTARTLSFLWYALSQNPEVEARLHAELDAAQARHQPHIDSAGTLGVRNGLPMLIEVR